jgi:hypothetical protein
MISARARALELCVATTSYVRINLGDAPDPKGQLVFPARRAYLVIVRRNMRL